MKTIKLFNHSYLIDSDKWFTKDSVHLNTNYRDNTVTEIELQVDNSK